MMMTVMFCIVRHFVERFPQPIEDSKHKAPVGREAGTVEHIDATSPEHNAISHSIHCCVIIVFVIIAIM